MGYGNNQDRPPLFNPTEFPQQIQVVYPPWKGWDDIQLKKDTRKRDYAAMKVRVNGTETNWLLYEDELEIMMSIRPDKGDILAVQLREDGAGLSVEPAGSAPPPRRSPGRGNARNQPSPEGSKADCIKRCHAYQSFYRIGEVLGISEIHLAPFAATMVIPWEKAGAGEFPTVNDFEGGDHPSSQEMEDGY